MSVKKLIRQAARSLKGAHGNLSAVEYVRASIARDIIRERKALGLTQEQLAKLSGVRQETICRLETGLHSPMVCTVEKIERALKRAAAQNRDRHGVVKRS
jgi:predicted transcriptional regulator